MSVRDCTAARDPRRSAAMRVRAVCVAALAAAAAAAPARAADLYSQRLVVAAKPGVAERHGGVVQRRLGAIGALVVRARPGLARHVLLDRLRADKRVRYAEPDFLIRTSAVPDDPRFGDQYALDQIGGRD